MERYNEIHLNLTFEEDPPFLLGFEEDSPFCLGFEENLVLSYSGETYAGSYIVSPDFDGQQLETADKLMTDDVTVLPIEVARVSNTSGGTTVYIGGI